MLKLKKSLGQNLLIDKNIINKILSLTNITNKNVLEIGPGTGNLTKHLLEKNPKELLLIEKDKQLCRILNLKFNTFKNYKIYNEDILKFHLNSNFKSEIVFGNLPYNISTKIVCNWILKLEQDFWFSELILMFQKEVADRIISKINSSNYGRLTIFLNWKMDIKKVFDISPNCFYPKPKIYSTLIHFTPKNNYFELNEGKNLEKITRVFFNQKRKKIKNPLKQLFPNYHEVSEKLKLDLNLRPQNLSLKTYCNIVKEYEKLIN